MKRIIACTIAALTTIIVFGQSMSDSVKVYFDIAQWQFNPSLGDNAASMNAFIEKVRVAYEAHNLDRIAIRAYASPDGPDRLNQRLSVERCDAIAGLIVERAGINRNLIEAMPEGVAWAELRRLVAETPDVPSQEKILDIIDNTPVWVFDGKGRIVSSRKKQLMDLRGGRPYNWLLEHIFPKLRNSVAVSLYLRAEAPEVMPADDDAAAAAPDTLCVAPVPLPVEQDSVSVAVDVAVAGDGTGEASAEGQLSPPYHRIALKTNLLYYGLLLPNLELEWLINKHWSVAAEGNLAWWGSYKHEKSYRLTLIDGEGRYWIKPRAPWHGMYAGVMAGGGWYDLENGSPGHYGWGVMSGLTFGYMWPIKRNLSLEAEIGAGYMYTRYKDYEPIEGHHVYLRTKEMNYFGPLKLKFSIVWRFLEVNKSKRVNTAL